MKRVTKTIIAGKIYCLFFMMLYYFVLFFNYRETLNHYSVVNKIG